MMTNIQKAICEVLVSLPGKEWTAIIINDWVELRLPDGEIRTTCGLTGCSEEECVKLIGRAAIQHYVGDPCPVTGKEFEHAFSDTKRVGWPMNACHQCHEDQETIGERLHKIADEREDGRVGS